MNRMKRLLTGTARLLRVQLLLWSLGLLAGAHAAENPAAEPEEQAEPDSEELQSQTPDDETEEPTAEEEESPGRFIPTEEISQDLGVSFPVDI